MRRSRELLVVASMLALSWGAGCASTPADSNDAIAEMQEPLTAPGPGPGFPWSGWHQHPRPGRIPFPLPMPRPPVASASKLSTEGRLWLGSESEV